MDTSTTTPAQAMPLVAYSDGRYTPNEEALAWLETLGSPLCVIACAGKYRTGKSTLLNRGILELTKADAQKAFGVGNTTQACTKGLWVYTRTIECAQGRAVVIDTEGFGAIRVDQTHDTRIFALALLISSMFVYNAEGPIDEQSIETLRVVSNISKHIRMGAADTEMHEEVEGEDGDGDGGVEDGEDDNKKKRRIERNDVESDDASLSSIMPYILFVQRNFTLKIANSSNGRGGGRGVADQYLEEALSSGGGDTSTPGEQIRKTLRTIFRQRGCVTLPPPSGEEDILQQMNTIGLDKLRPEFVRQLKAFRKRLGDEVEPKRIMGKPINGFLLAAYIRSLAAALNAGAAPVIHDQWTALATMQKQKLIESAMRSHERSIAKVVVAQAHHLLVDVLEQLEEEAVQKVRKNIMVDGPSAEDAIVDVRVVCKERSSVILERRAEATLREVGRAIDDLERDVVTATDMVGMRSIIDQAWEKLEALTGAGRDITDPVRAAWTSEVSERIWKWVSVMAEGTNEWRRRAEESEKEMDVFIARVKELETSLEAESASASVARGEVQLLAAERERSTERSVAEIGRLNGELVDAKSTNEEFVARLETFGPMHARIEVAERSLEEERLARQRAVDGETASRETATQQISTMEAAANEAVTEARTALEMQRHRSDRAERELARQKEESEARVGVIAHDLEVARAECKRAVTACESNAQRHETELQRARRDAERATQKVEEAAKAHTTEATSLREEARRATDEKSDEHKERLRERTEASGLVKELEIRLAVAETASAELRQRFEEEEERGRAARGRADHERAALAQATSEMVFLREDRKGLEERLRDATTRIEALERENRETGARHNAEMASARLAHERERGVLEQRLASSSYSSSTK